jgi:hypothetical protein
MMIIVIINRDNDSIDYVQDENGDDDFEDGKLIQ